jgi:hypothetical protein
LILFDLGSNHTSNRDSQYLDITINLIVFSHENLLENQVKLLKKNSLYPELTLAIRNLLQITKFSYYYFIVILGVKIFCVTRSLQITQVVAFQFLQEKYFNHMKVQKIQNSNLRRMPSSKKEEPTNNNCETFNLTC